MLLLIKTSDAYTESAAFAASHSLVTARLGTPVKATGIPLGSVTRNGAFGQAQLSFDLEGPRGRARVHVTSHRDGTRWPVDRAVLAVGGDSISLNAGGPNGVER